MPKQGTLIRLLMGAAFAGRRVSHQLPNPKKASESKVDSAAQRAVSFWIVIYLEPYATDLGCLFRVMREAD